MDDISSLPTFRYHPDPIATGSIVQSDERCGVCGVSRGYIYNSGIYGSAKELDGLRVCPWCIADGSVHDRFGGEFTGIGAIGWGYGVPWDSVPKEVEEEIAYRTPGFSSWQDERWWTHCGDGAEFLGPAGRKELTNEWAGAIEVIKADTGYPLGPNAWTWEETLEGMDRDHGPTAYVFRCRHCGALGGYWDCH